MPNFQAKLDGIIKLKADDKEQARKKILEELERIKKLSKYPLELNIKKP